MKSTRIMIRNMIGLLVLSMAFMVTLAGVVAAQPQATKPAVYQPLAPVKAKYEAAIRKAEEDYQKAVRDATQVALKEVTALVPQAVKSGDLDAANAVNDTKKRLEEELKTDLSPPTSRSNVASHFVGTWCDGSLIVKADGTLSLRSGRTGTWVVTGPKQVTIKWVTGLVEVVDFRAGAETTHDQTRHSLWLKVEKGE